MLYDPIWQAFTQTGDPLYYLLYCSIQRYASELHDNILERETAAGIQ